MPAFTASNTTAAGSLPSECFIISTPARCVHTSSCSIAAARNVSAAATTTFLPLLLRLYASFPIVVVLPAPFTPITSITVGFVSRISSFSPSSIPAIIFFNSPFTSAGSVVPVAFTSFLKASQIFALVTAPMSDKISVSSSSSKKSSSIFVNELITPVILLARASFVFFKPFFSFSNNPIEKFSPTLYIQPAFPKPHRHLPYSRE